MRRVLQQLTALFVFALIIALSSPSLAQEWAVRSKPRGTVKVVDLFLHAIGAGLNCYEPLITLDKDNNWIPCLAQDWRWVDDRTIEFKLREGVRFHNGEKFNAEAVKVNWEAYKEMELPNGSVFLVIPDETVFEISDEYKVRFTFPEPDGLAFSKFRWFSQFAPAFLSVHKFDHLSWGFPPEAGPWGTGPFKLVEGGLSLLGASDRVVLEANEDYWDPKYPMLKGVIYNNALIGAREHAMKLCMDEEGQVDIVSRIRPLDTLKVAESPFAKVVKSKDVTKLDIWFNQRKKDSKWRDIRLRKAVNYGINREELWKYGAKGNAYNLSGHLSPGVYGHNPEKELYTYDTDRARSLLTEAGYPDGFEVKIITPEAWKLETQIMSRMLERVGELVS